MIFTKEKLKHYTKEFILFSVVMILFTNALSLYKSQDLNKQSFDLPMSKLIDGTIYRPKKGSATLLHVWGTWCPVCKAEADNIQRVSQDYEVITVAVNSGSDLEIKEYLKEHGLNYRVINDHTSSLAQKLNVLVYPTTFIYDKSGKLLFSEVGYTSNFGLYLRMWWASL